MLNCRKSFHQRKVCCTASQNEIHGIFLIINYKIWVNKIHGILLIIKYLEFEHKMISFDRKSLATEIT